MSSSSLNKSIDSKPGTFFSSNRNVSVIGLGYVGLPVAVAFGKYGKVIGFDINSIRISELKTNHDHTHEVEYDELCNANISYTTNSDDLRKANFHIIAVPTPINKTKQPNLQFLIDSCETVGRVLKKGDIVVCESTIYPGCTEEKCIPILEQESGLEVGIDFGVGYSPERINPGDKEHSFTNIRKIVSGNSPEILKIVSKVYSSVITAGVYEAPSIKVAEAAKVIENVQRDLNIAFINELAMIFDRIEIDTSEVLKAAGTKWNFLPFQPGLVGGHCIGVDPYYLMHRAERAGYNPELILAGRQINDKMGFYIAQRTIQTMAQAGYVAQGAKVAVLGLTFKENCPDLRNSRVPDIIMKLRNYGCEVVIHDPLCDPKEAEEEYGLCLIPSRDLGEYNAVVVAVAHQIYQDWNVERWQEILLTKAVVVDVKGIVPREELQTRKHLVWRL